jgi:hypothetical protein
MSLNLPHALRSLDFKDVLVENDTILAHGGSSPAMMMMKMSAEQLRQEYISTGEVTSGEIDIVNLLRTQILGDLLLDHCCNGT